MAFGNVSSATRLKLVFVPGIMGSELYREVFEEGEVALEPVWAREQSVFWATLSRRPKVLWSTTPLRPGRVIRYIGRTSVYGNFLKFLETELGYREGDDLIPFAYDWRQSNQITAARLATEISGITRTGTKDLILVGHSMGGIIIRLMLGDPRFRDAAERVKKAILIASPGRGSANAFATLQTKPDLVFWLDLLLPAKQWLKPQLQNDLLHALLSFDSLLELLPPDSEEILVDGEDFRWSALDQRAWPSHLSGRLAGVRQMHRIIRAKQAPHVSAIYSTGQSTDREYLVDDLFQLKKPYGWVKGDSRVSHASAVEGIDPVNCHGLKHSIPHGGVPDSPECCDLLASLLRP